ncbi:hypothetical protein D3C73_1234220 [compost metagenome]
MLLSAEDTAPSRNVTPDREDAAEAGCAFMVIATLLLRAVDVPLTAAAGRILLAVPEEDMEVVSESLPVFAAPVPLSSSIRDCNWASSSLTLFSLSLIFSASSDSSVTWLRSCCRV